MFDLEGERAGLLLAAIVILFQWMGAFVDRMAASTAAGPACWHQQPVYAKPLGKSLFRIEGPEYGRDGRFVRYVPYGTAHRKDISFQTSQCWKLPE